MHEITHLIHVDPKRAREMILAAFKAEGCHKGDTAKRLQCERNALARWIAELKLEPTIKAMTARARDEGWKRTGGGYPAGRERSVEFRLQKIESHAAARKEKIAEAEAALARARTKERKARLQKTLARLKRVDARARERASELTQA